MTKIRVEIIAQNGTIIKRKKYPIEGDKILIDPGRKGKGGAAWNPRFTKDSLLFYQSGIWPLKVSRQKVMIIDDAEKAVEWKNDALAPIPIPYPSRDTIRRYFKAEVLQKAGTLGMKIQVPTILYLVSLLGIVFSFLTLMVVTGRMRI